MRVRLVLAVAVAAGAALAAKRRRTPPEDVWKQATEVRDLR